MSERAGGQGRAREASGRCPGTRPEAIGWVLSSHRQTPGTRPVSRGLRALPREQVVTAVRHGVGTPWCLCSAPLWGVGGPGGRPQRWPGTPRRGRGRAQRRTVHRTLAASDRPRVSHVRWQHRHLQRLQPLGLLVLAQSRRARRHLSLIS